MRNLKILVVIPAYNAANFLRETVESLLCQTYPAYKIVIIDDCSQDGTLDLIRELGEEFREVNGYGLSHNVGTYEAINHGLRLSRFIYWDAFCIHGADDCSTKNRFELACKKIKNNLMVTSGCRKYDVRTGEVVKRRDVNSSMCIYKRRVFEEMGYFDRVRYGGDSEYFERFKKFYGERWALVPEELSVGKLHGDNLTQRVPLSNKDRLQYKAKFREKHRTTSLKNKVLVIMPSYNSEAWIEEAAKSVLEGDHYNLTLCLVDDCSQDGTLDLMLDLMKYDKRVTVLQSDKNRGAYHCRNLALKKIKDWDLFTVVDSDDTVTPEMITNRLEALGGCHLMSQSKYLRVNEAGEVVQKAKFGVTMVLYNREVVERIGYYLEVRSGGDSEYFERAKLAFPGTLVKLDSVDYRALFHGKNMTEKKDPKVISKFIADYQADHKRRVKEGDFYVS